MPLLKSTGLALEQLPGVLHLIVPSREQVAASIAAALDRKLLRLSAARRPISRADVQPLVTLYDASRPEIGRYEARTTAPPSTRAAMRSTKTRPAGVALQYSPNAITRQSHSQHACSAGQGGRGQAQKVPGARTSRHNACEGHAAAWRVEDDVLARPTKLALLGCRLASQQTASERRS